MRRSSGAGGVAEELDAVLARPLGLVHRGVGVAQQRVRVGLAGRGEPAADADADVAALAADVERLAERGAQPSGGHRRLRLVLDAGAEDGELVAAEAGDHVVVADRAAQPVRDLDQQPVAGLVAEAVVDDLEVVEVEEQHRDALPVAGGDAQRRQERGAIRQPGESVESRSGVEDERGQDSLTDRRSLHKREPLVREPTHVRGRKRQVPVEGAPARAFAAHHAQQRGERARREAGQRALQCAAPRRTPARGRGRTPRSARAPAHGSAAAASTARSSRAGLDPEVERGPDALAREREAVAGAVADEEHAVVGRGAQAVREPVALVAHGVAPQAAARSPSSAP